MSTHERRSIRCAIYTRKSSEEGLEQSFNSLDAQREACQSYILSQRQEGWRAIDAHYDDGGYSGGSMERPGLKRLLVDIEAKIVDTVVVYKVDRLTRSLADFAKIVEAFDARGVSFVSVTQQFNTTSSMGRLTLNVLLSFAQFEREVTGERIRDKIAASKRKGMWMGGMVPLGYDLKDRHLILNEEEAEHVREIFRLYLELGCVKKLKAHFDKSGVKSKIRVSHSGQRIACRASCRNFRIADQPDITEPMPVYGDQSSNAAQLWVNERFGLFSSTQDHPQEEPLQQRPNTFAQTNLPPSHFACRMAADHTVTPPLTRNLNIAAIRGNLQPVCWS
jgi:DNA invertase Pin-like site-specific DNA recombinase